MRHVDLNTAKTLQELGYDGEAAKWYARDGSLKSTNLVDDDIPAPRLDDAAYWLRDKYHLSIRISYCDATEDWFYDILDVKTGDYWDEADDYYTNYDDALEVAVIKALEIIKNRQHDGRD